MKTSFESLMEEIIPEINFLTASGRGLKPGHVMESLEKDIVIGYLPDFVRDYPSMNGKSFETITEPYDIRVEEVNGTISNDGALKFMDLIGLKYNRDYTYKIDFDIEEMTSLKYAQNLNKINFEIALRELRDNDRKTFKLFKGHFLVFRVLYANKYKVTIEVDKGAGFEPEINTGSIEAGANINLQRSENAILVNHNEEVPFGVVGFKIKGRKLKEVD